MTQICCYFARGGVPFGTQLPDMFVFKKSYWSYRYLAQQFVKLRISSCGYVKDILWVLVYNNFYANIRLALFKAVE